MSKIYKFKGIINTVLLALLTFAIIKLVWSLVNFIFLPSIGVNVAEDNYKASLYTPFKVAIPTRKKEAPVKKVKRGINLRMLTLEGIYKDNKDPKKSIAIISKGGMPKVVSIGEKLFGFKLKEVNSGSVILEKGNKEYNLELPKNQVQSDQYILTKSNSTSSLKSSHNSKSSRTSGPSPIKEEDGEKIVPRTVIQEYSKDMRKIWRNIALSDYKENGTLKGFRVRFIKKGSIFDQLGLQQGDIITGINGEAVKSYSLPMKIFSNIGGLDNLILQVKRGNNEVELEYEIR